MPAKQGAVILRFPDREPAPTPLLWFVRLTRAVSEGDHELEAESIKMLRRFGYVVAVDPRWRRGAKS